MLVVDGLVDGQVRADVRGVLRQLQGRRAYEATDRKSINFQSAA
ncbi:hypothetical protein ACIOJG_14325 [Streptomyces anulatus]